MPHPTAAVAQSEAVDLANILRRLAAVPAWLSAAVQPDLISAALLRHVPELASGELLLHSCSVKRLLLQDTTGHWVGTYNPTFGEPQGEQRRKLALLGTLPAPWLAKPPEPEALLTSQPFGSDGWRIYLPELTLALEMQPAEAALDALPRLTDPEAARDLLEQSISAGALAYRDLRIRACTPKVLSYKPGSRCTIRYHLDYPPELAANRGWPETVIAKTYRNSKGQNAYDGMRALWDSPLSTGDVVTIAEPLAYVPELRLLLQGPVREEQTLEDLLRAALSTGDAETMAQLEFFMRKAAAGLAALHQTPVEVGRPVAWEDKFADVQKVLRQLAVPAPELADVLRPLLAHLEALATTQPAGALVPTHGTFNPEQVLISQGQIGLIDFDDFCQAEPALDVGFFRAAIKDTGMKNGSEAASGEARLRQLELLDQIGDVFLLEYERLAPLSRQRVALYEAQQYLRDALHTWAKFKPQAADRDNALLILAQHLRRMGM